LKLPFHHTSGLSILLLISHPRLSILLLNKSTELPFFKALSIFFNSQSLDFQLTINAQTRHKRVAVSLLPTAEFKYPGPSFLIG
jgi:hypothetical protein